MAIAAPPNLLLLLFITLSSPTAGWIASPREAEVRPVSREFFPLDGDVAWVVQVSDLHLSAYHPERGEELASLLGPALRVIRPSLLLVTGDLTDAKNKRRTSTRQDESEWIQYRNAMDAILKQSGIEKRRIFDIRGNHDKYGVPYVGDKLDFFSIHSVSSLLNRQSTIQSISLVGHNRRYNFLGIDDTITVGIRGPSNFFGHPTDSRIDAVESELQHWDSQPGESVTKVVFGHFPISFTASSEKGRNYRNVFARQSVSAYICGHLHAKFSKKLWRLHRFNFPSNHNETKGVKQFWEWELGDWKESRLIRLLAIDGGRVSFLDFDLSSKNQVPEDFQTTIFITYPTDSRCMNQIEPDITEFRNDINALVFSVQPILNVTAWILDSSRAFKIVEELPLQHVTSSSDHGPLFHAKWNAENYKSLSASRFWLQIFAVDAQGKKTASVVRPFSVEGKLAHYSSSWLAYLIFNFQWEVLCQFLLWSNVCFLILLLFLPKLLDYFIERNESYQRWAMSVSVSSPIQQKVLFWVLWFLIEGSRSRKFWSAMVIYLLYLLTMPWFFGHATSEDGNIAQMYIHGWSMQSQQSPFMKEMHGKPDVMTITLPVMYLVVTPMFLLIYSLFVKTTAICLSTSRKSRYSHEQEVVARAPQKSFKDIICRDWTQISLLLTCLLVMLIHFKLSIFLMAAYGIAPVALSPVLTWVPPLLLASAVSVTINSEAVSLPVADELY